MTIADNGPGGTQVLSLTGIGGTAGANATLSPNTVDFGDQKAGTTSAAQAVTLSNHGTASLYIADISASDDFSETNNCNTTLASGASCTVNVTFSPSETGTLSGTVSIADDAPNSPQEISLSGNGSTGSCQTKGEQCGGGHGRQCCLGLVRVEEGDRNCCEQSAAGFALRDR